MLPTKFQFIWLRKIEALEKLRSLEVFSMDSLVLIESLSAMNEDSD